MLLLEVTGLRREGVPGNERSVLLTLEYMEILLLSCSLSLSLTTSTLKFVHQRMCQKHTVDCEIFAVKNFSLMTFSDEN